MSVADASMPFTVVPPVAAAPAPLPAPSLPLIAPPAAVGPRPPAPPLPADQAPWNLPRTPAPRPDGLDRSTGRLLAAAFGIAWILCPAVEPMPSGDVHYPLWQLPIDLAAVASIVAAVVVLWRGGRNGPRLGVTAGALMAVLTILCPFAGHTPLGWWTWAQTGLSLFVLGTSVALMSHLARQAARATPAPR